MKDNTLNKPPVRSSFMNEDDYRKAWIEYYGTQTNRSREQWKRLVKKYGAKKVAEMEDMSVLEVKREAGLLTFKDKINSLRKSK